MLITIRRLIALGLLFTGLGFLVWASLPVMPLVKAVTLTPKDMQPVVDGSHGAVALLEQRQVRLEWPATMRIGDEYRVHWIFHPPQVSRERARRANMPIFTPVIMSWPRPRLKPRG